MTPIVSRIDHLVVPVEDPESLFEVLTTRLGLPALWPVVDLGPFRSAAVALGNAWIEIVADAESLTPLYAATLPAVFRGISFASPLSCADTAAALDAAGVARGEPRSFSGRRPDGTDGVLVTTLPIDGLVADAGIAYVCEMALPVDAARVAAKTQKAVASGGVGMRSIGEIQIGVRDVASAARRWSAIADTRDGDDRWLIGDGPSVRIKESPLDGISGITVRVDSLSKATDALRSLGLLGAVRSSGVGINHAAVQGLDIWLTDGP